MLVGGDSMDEGDRCTQGLTFGQGFAAIDAFTKPSLGL
jgi:hypothetical protein